jgi:hypothetical protein
VIRQSGAGDDLAKALLQQVAGRELGQVLGDVDAARLQLEHLDGLALLARAEDEADRSLLALLPLVAIEPAEIELHLAHIGRLEIADFQFDDDQPPQTPVVEEQIEVVVVAIQRDPLLPLDEGEAGAELQEERLGCWVNPGARAGCTA